MIIQRYGDLEIGYTTDWTPESSGSGFTGWRPKARAGGWRALGLALANGEPDPRGQRGGLLIRMAGGQDNGLLAAPAGWSMVAGPPYRAYRPRPPEGYVALSDGIGSAGLTGPIPPGNFEVWCVRRDLVRPAEIGDKAYSAGGKSAWTIALPPYPHGDITEHIYIPATQFTFHGTDDKPAPTDVTYVLDLPAAVETVEGPEVPELDGPGRPPAQEVITDRAVIVPYQMVSDDARDEAWRVDSTPFYRVLRKRSYDLVLYRDNREGTTEVTEAESVTTGVSDSKEEAFSESTGITVTETTGVSAGFSGFGFSSSVSHETSTSQSIETGYERRYGVTTMREVTKERAIVVPPGAVGCLWMERHDLLPARADGDMISGDAILNFTTDYYVTGEWPGRQGLAYYEGADPATAGPPASLEEQHAAHRDDQAPAPSAARAAR